MARQRQGMEGSSRQSKEGEGAVEIGGVMAEVVVVGGDGLWRGAISGLFWVLFWACFRCLKEWLWRCNGGAILGLFWVLFWGCFGC